MASVFLAINHVAIQVKDLSLSKHFYTHIIGFQPIARPDLGFEGAWFAIGASQELHLLPDLNHQIHSGSRTNHWAVEVDAYEPIIQSLEKFQYPYRAPKQRIDMVWQLFVNDPDGHTIEFLKK
jgi:catechol 2,3-dioxygenase-like lactoylglutathione lyase family enzyme